MLAYMNEEAYNKTLETGIMTYYSRSRQELWVKGLTSGHFQYVVLLILTATTTLYLQRFVRLALHATPETEPASIET